MGLLLGTLELRPYVLAFLACFVVAGARDLGWWRTVAFGAIVWPIAWAAEFSSTRIGLPFGLYHYTELTRDRELFIANVPVMDSLSFTFLAYAAFALARWTLGGRWTSRAAVAGLSGALMMLLDVVIDPLAVRGDRWFLGRIFYYHDGGVYFGVPLSNFAGWLVVGALSVGLFVFSVREWRGRNPRGGIALYYGVVGFNLTVTVWIGEWLLAAVGLALHSTLARALRYVHQNAEARMSFGERGAESA